MPATEVVPLPFDPVKEANRQWVAHGWTDAADGMSAVTSIVRAHQIFLARIDEVLRPLGLTFARYEVLMLLSFSKRGALPLSRIGARLQVHPTSVTSAVDRLERQGFVKRKPHPTDRRTVLAKITPTGRLIADRATIGLNAAVFTRPGLSSDAVKLIVAVLGDLRHAAGDF